MVKAVVLRGIASILAIPGFLLLQSDSAVESQTLPYGTENPLPYADKHVIHS